MAYSLARQRAAARERHRARRGVQRRAQPQIDVDDLPAELQQAQEPALSRRPCRCPRTASTSTRSSRDIERELIQRSLERTGGNKGQAARAAQPEAHDARRKAQAYQSSVAAEARPRRREASSAPTRGPRSPAVGCPRRLSHPASTSGSARAWLILRGPPRPSAIAGCSHGEAASMCRPRPQNEHVRTPTTVSDPRVVDFAAQRLMASINDLPNRRSCTRRLPTLSGISDEQVASALALSTAEVQALAMSTSPKSRRLRAVSSHEIGQVRRAALAALIRSCAVTTGARPDGDNRVTEIEQAVVPTVTPDELRVAAADIRGR